jgi:hypothetical protein
MKSKKNRPRAFLAVLFATMALASAYAYNTYLGSFDSTYPAAANTAISDCKLCHVAGSNSLNPYGKAYAAASHSFSAIESADSDGDGFSNLREIMALTFPGDSASRPAAPPADTTAPNITGFSIPAASDSLTVAVTLAASDNVGVTGYRISESAATPTAGSAGWSASAPSSFTFAGAGARTLYAWAKDAAGNVSASANDTTTITLAPAPDTTAPTVNAFSIPATSGSLAVPITSLVASDNVGVTGYQITESATTPAAGAAGWTTSPPPLYTFASAGTKTLHAWAKDAAGNVSTSRSATTTITLVPAADTIPPVVTGFSIPAASASLTVPITSLTASDAGGVTGYLVTESPTRPPASAAGWSSSPQASFTFTSAGSKTLFAWAMDAAGNISGSRSASTTITLGDSASPDMTVWVGKWFKVRINRDAGKESWKWAEEESDDDLGEIGYLEIQSWDSEASLLQGRLHYRTGHSGPWLYSELPLHFGVGTPLRFLFWFEYAQEFQFAAGMIAKAENGAISMATFNAAGIYLFKNEDEMDDDVNLALTIVGKMVPEGEVPADLLNN